MLQRVSDASRPFRDLLNLSTSSVNHNTSCLPAPASDRDVLHEFPLEIDSIPNHVSIYYLVSDNGERLYVDFVDSATGKTRCKRLSAKWLAPPSEYAHNPEAWYRAHIGSVLAKARGPENTPGRPPARLPPKVTFSASARGIDEEEFAQLKLALKERDEEISRLRAFQQQEVDDETIVVAMFREDLKDMQAQVVLHKQEADARTRLCLQALDEAEKREVELDAAHKQTLAVRELFHQQANELKLLREQVSKLEAKLLESETKVDTLQNYSSGLLRAPSSSHSVVKF
ncbi:hypothetical protein BASA81_005509 [Batrachochytrium salamandrivorans]|nr:hypothetical protein BASA81_005509 [Batrachochytrium salamandrivorans]